MHGPGASPRAKLFPDLLVMSTAVFAMLATAAVLIFPTVRFAYSSPGFHIVLETTASMAAALAALLFFGRLREKYTSSGWGLVYALTMSSLVNMFLAVVPSLMNQPWTVPFSEWGALFGRMFAAIGFAYAAFAPDEAQPRRRFLGAKILSAAAGTLLIISIVILVFLPDLPRVITGSGNATIDGLTPHPIVPMLQGISLTLFGGASLGFLRRSAATGDVLLRWLSAGSLLAAISRFHYVLYPTLYADWVYSGDFLRLGFYVMLLIGAVTEIRRYWYGLADAATQSERRRLARDLHDGVAQELAYIVAQARLLRSAEDPAPVARTIAGAAGRALDESRRAIAALSMDQDQPLDIALAQAAEEVAARVGANVTLDIERGVDVSPPAREALIRIAREAISNAGRHSHSDAIDVQLSANGRVRLTVRDHGIGFDPQQDRSDCFGLISMRERANALEADFEVTSAPGRGTTVEVAL